MAGAALRFGDFTSGHFIGNIGAAERRFFMTARGGNIEPFVRFDKISIDTVAAGGIDNAQIEQG